LRARIANKWIVLAVFGGLFAILFIWVGVANGIGNPSVPSGDVAVVEGAPDGTISTADFQLGLKQIAAAQGVQKVPSPSDPQYATLRDATMSDLLLTRWIGGEAEERGITVSNTEVSSYIKQQFGGTAKFLKEAKAAKFTPAQARARVRNAILLPQEIQKQVLPSSPTVSSDEVNQFYEANQSQFQQPETRDVRQIVNKDQAKVARAKALLSKDDSAQSWKKVAAKYSTDRTTKGNGGLRQGVAKGQSEPVADSQIFSAPQGQLVGPFKGQAGYYLIEVDSITPAKTTPLASVSSQIQQQLSQGLQQQIAQNFQQDFTDKWTMRTFCASGYVTDRCANFTAQDSCNGDDPGETGNLDKTGCQAVVPSTRPVSAGQATVFPGESAQGLAQGPQTGSTASAQPGVIGPGGAPQLPPGAAPQGTAPQGAAPQGAAPTQTAP
jgi:parvulin-like peptidyl-prolyl isomerase